MIGSLIWILNPSSWLIILLVKSFTDFGKKVVCAFREIDYKKWTPLITKVFGSADFIGIEDSGINELFKPPRRGRPPKADAKKRQRQDFAVEYQPTTSSSRRNLRQKAPPLDASSSDTNKILNIAVISLQAIDIIPHSATSCIPLRSLNKEATQWWNLL